MHVELMTTNHLEGMKAVKPRVVFDISGLDVETSAMEGTTNPAFTVDP